MRTFILSMYLPNYSLFADFDGSSILIAVS